MVDVNMAQRTTSKPGLQKIEQAICILPNIRVRGTTVFCNRRKLDLSRRPLTLKLFKAFLKNPNQRLTRKQIVNCVYECLNPEEKSARLNEALAANVTKLISRTRTLATKSFRSEENDCIEWLVYEPISEAWYLFRLKNHYIREKEREIRGLVN